MACSARAPWQIATVSSVPLEPWITAISRHELLGRVEATARCAATAARSAPLASADPVGTSVLGLDEVGGLGRP